MTDANTFLYNLTNSKKSVVLNQNSENNKVMKYIGGDNIVYKNIYVQNENNLDYYGKISEVGQTLKLESSNISMSGNLLVSGANATFNNNLFLNGALSRGVPVTKTGNFTVDNNENWIICNGSATISVTLPTASVFPGRELMFKNITG